MSSSTYLQLVNKVLRHLNQVELNQNNFDTAKGIYAAVRDSVNYSINHINSLYNKWPFNLVEDQSQTLVVGQNKYDFPSDFKVIDWDSFRLHNDGTLNTETKFLRYLPKEIFVRHYNTTDLDNTSSGVGIPVYIVPWYNRWAITPSPDKAYIVKYNYWKTPTQLSNYDDTPTIPNEWDQVIVVGAIVYGHLFKENIENTQMFEQKFKMLIEEMLRVLVGFQQDATDTRINFGQRGFSRYATTDWFV